MTPLFERLSGGVSSMHCPDPPKRCIRSALPGFETCPHRPTIKAQFRNMARTKCNRPDPT